MDEHGDSVYEMEYARRSLKGDQQQAEEWSITNAAATTKKVESMLSVFFFLIFTNYNRGFQMTEMKLENGTSNTEFLFIFEGFWSTVLIIKEGPGKYWGSRF